MQRVEILLEKDVGHDALFKNKVLHQPQLICLISDIPWESNIQKYTLQRCQSLYSKLKKNIVSLKLLAESRESLEIVTHSLRKLVDVYLTLGPTTDTFVEVMRKIKEIVMGPDTWEVVKQSFPTKMAKSMFNLKEGLKRKMLKVQYFKQPDIAGYLYDRHLATYGRLPWNDEVPIYFEKIFMKNSFWE